MYQDAFERFLAEKEENEVAALEFEIEKPVYLSDVADREE